MSCLFVFSSLFKLEKSILGRKSTVNHIVLSKGQTNAIVSNRLMMWKLEMNLQEYSCGKRFIILTGATFFQIVLDRMTCSLIYYSSVFVSL